MRDPNKVFQGIFALPRGMNSGRAPVLLTPQEVAYAVNVTFRGGFATTRPSWRQRQLQFPNEETQMWFEEHFVQGYDIYDPPNGEPVIVTSVGGRLFAINQVSYGVTEFTPPDGDRNGMDTPVVWFCQAEQFLIVQDGINQPIIWDGGNQSRRAISDASEVPVGRQMAYGLGRLFVVDPTARKIFPGDFVNEDGTSVIKFTEIDSLNGGGAITPSLSSGDITALKFTTRPNTPTGVGQLLCFTRSNVTSFNPIPNRALWGSIEFGSIALITSGAVTGYSTVSVNGDIFYRAPDGIRSFIMAARDFDNQWGNTPQSYEMLRVMEQDTDQLLQFSSAVYFDNRLLMTCIPRPWKTRCFHEGLVALNFDNVSSIYDKSVASYDGLWVGTQIYGLTSGYVDGEQRCHMLVKGEDNVTELWEIEKSKNFDTHPSSFDNDGIPITSVLELGSFTFGDITRFKHLFNAEAWYDQIIGPFNRDYKFRPDEYPCYVDWYSVEDCAKYKDCGEEAPGPTGCKTVHTYRPQYRPREALPQAPDDCLAYLGRQANAAYHFQIRIQWTAGHARLKMFRASALLQDDEPQPECLTNG